MNLLEAPQSKDRLWRDGWHQFSGQLHSPNFGPRPLGIRVDMIVLHSISLPPGEYGGGNIQRLFTNQLNWEQHPYFKSIRGMEVSAHFLIARNGELLQFVNCNDRAWHAGASHYRGKENCNDNAIGIELEGLENGPFEEFQYETLASLCAAILQKYPIKHVLGHEHISPGRKLDPGKCFDWARLQRSVGLTSQQLPDGILIP